MSRRAIRVSLVFARALTVVWWLLAAGGGVAATFIGLELLRGARGRVSLPMTLGSVPGVQFNGVATGVGHPEVTRLSGTVEVTAPASVGLGILAVVVTAVLIMLGVLWQLRALFASLSAGTPFHQRNAHRIRIIAVLVAVAELGRAGVEWGAGRWLQAHTIGPVVHADFVPSLEILAIAVMLWLLAEVFALGTRLQDENDLTV